MMSAISVIAIFVVLKVLGKVVAIDYSKQIRNFYDNLDDWFPMIFDDDESDVESEEDEEKAKTETDAAKTKTKSLRKDDVGMEATKKRAPQARDLYAAKSKV